MEEYLLEMKNIHKRFPGVYALKGVDLTLKAGEVMARWRKWCRKINNYQYTWWYLYKG